MKVLVTGGAGYIGSHTCLELLINQYDVVVVDNFFNSSIESIKRVEQLTGKTISFYEADIRDEKAMNNIFDTNKIDAVIHFAGLKAVGESVEKPLEYYENNISGTLVLCNVMRQHNVKNIVFSSSATVYGKPASLPIREDFPLSVTNPYGRTKLMLEEILSDIYVSDHDWNVILLRYFNPIGAHKSGRIGENPKGIPNNLIPFVTQVACGKHPNVRVFGDDYDTADGTGVRDYIHVVDLAIGHIKALEKLMTKPGLQIYNLGTGNGYSVLEIIKTFEQVSGQKIPYKVEERRKGDIAACYADSSKAKKELNWEAKYDLKTMCQDSWNWQKNNPNGYTESK